MPAAFQLSIVVPCYNEEAVIRESARQLKACVDQLARIGKISGDSRIIFINDGSRDRTWELIENLCREDRIFSGVSLSRNFGHQCALLAGLHAAPGDAVITIDADLQDDPAAIEQMIDEFHQGRDVVYGVRGERKSDSAFKRWTAFAFYRMMGLLGARTVHNHGDFRLMSRRAVDALRDYGESNLFLRGIVPLIGFPSATVTYDRRKRAGGETKYSLWKMLALSASAVTSFSNFPLRLITITALGGIVVLIGISMWAAWIRLFTDRGVPGWASILLPMLLIGSLNLLAIGIVGEYLARIFDEVKARPRYLIAATRNLPASQNRDIGAGASSTDS